MYMILLHLLYEPCYEVHVTICISSLISQV